MGSSPYIGSKALLVQGVGKSPEIPNTPSLLAGPLSGPARVLRLVLGTAAVPRRDPGWWSLWDRFHEAGGNCFDAAFHYGETAERTLGGWIASRGVRDELVIVSKSAHTPACRPESVAPQLEESLERLRTDRVEIHLLHRDDPAVPVGEFVDALDEQVRKGRARAVGVSNWTVERAQAFDEYAELHGRARLALLSNQLSLAEMVQPVWAGCRCAFDAETRTWLEQRRLPLLAWSARARGFFEGRADDDEEVTRCWLSKENVTRRRRARALAGRRGVAPVAVALAWVLAQRFPTLAAVGPRSPEELETCLSALQIELDPDEVQALEGVPGSCGQP
jgi:aryl-alcohol dehydrogenase-like predicted oxidoreductase